MLWLRLQKHQKEWPQTKRGDFKRTVCETNVARSAYASAGFEESKKGFAAKVGSVLTNC